MYCVCNSRTYSTMILSEKSEVGTGEARWNVQMCTPLQNPFTWPGHWNWFNIHFLLVLWCVGYDLDTWFKDRGNRDQTPYGLKDFQNLPDTPPPQGGVRPETLKFSRFGPKLKKVSQKPAGICPFVPLHFGHFGTLISQQKSLNPNEKHYFSLMDRQNRFLTSIRIKVARHPKWSDRDFHGQQGFPTTNTKSISLAVQNPVQRCWNDSVASTASTPRSFLWQRNPVLIMFGT